MAEVADASDRLCYLCTAYSINLYASFAFPCFIFWVGSFPPSSLTLGEPPRCLNSGPGSEPAVNRGLGTLFLGYASNLSCFRFLFSFCYRPIPLCSPQGYALPRAISFLGTFPCVVLHREPLPLFASCNLRN